MPDRKLQRSCSSDNGADRLSELFSGNAPILTAFFSPRNFWSMFVRSLERWKNNAPIHSVSSQNGVSETYTRKKDELQTKCVLIEIQKLINCNSLKWKSCWNNDWNFRVLLYTEMNLMRARGFAGLITSVPIGAKRSQLSFGRRDSEIRTDCWGKWERTWKRATCLKCCFFHLRAITRLNKLRSWPGRNVRHIDMGACVC